VTEMCTVHLGSTMTTRFLPVCDYADENYENAYLSLRYVSMHEKMPLAFDLSRIFAQFLTETLRNGAADGLLNLAAFGQRFAEISPNEFHCAIFWLTRYALSLFNLH